MSMYETRIDATGECGNVFSVLGAATRMLRQINTPKEEINSLTKKVIESKSYDEALGYIEVYFPVIREDQ